MRFELNVPFKGQRSYLQSADLFQSVAYIMLAEGMGDNARLSFSFRKLIDTPCDLILAKSGEKLNIDPHHLLSDVVITDQNTKRFGALVPAVAGRTSERRDDFESAVKAALVFEEKQASSSGFSQSLAAIEAAIAITKFLHLEQIAQSIKWLAVRIDFALSFRDLSCQVMRAEIDKISAGLTTKTSIYCDNKFTGTIMFKPLQISNPLKSSLSE